MIQSNMGKIKLSGSLPMLLAEAVTAVQSVADCIREDYEGEDLEKKLKSFADDLNDAVMQTNDEWTDSQMKKLGKGVIEFMEKILCDKEKGNE